jgi:hypothetical protein
LLPGGTHRELHSVLVMHDADRGMVWQGHALAEQNRSFWGRGGVLRPGRILFLREVAATGFSLTSASIDRTAAAE